MSDTDWKREMRKIEREYDGLPPEPTAEEIRALRLAHSQEESDRRSASLAAAARIVLVTALLAALHWWPYSSDCGLMLGVFVGAQAMIAVGGLWIAVYAWRHRLGGTHALALMLLLTGLLLVAAQVLPRTGHVTIGGMEPAPWRCAAT